MLLTKLHGRPSELHVQTLPSIPIVIRLLLVFETFKHKIKHQLENRNKKPSTCMLKLYFYLIAALTIIWQAT
jgi:hypothetical protein